MLEVVPSSAVVPVICRLKSLASSDAGVTSRPLRSAGASVHVVTPSTTLEVPAFRVAPSGTPVIVIVMLSEPSVSTKAEEMFRAMALSSAPVTSVAVTVGASATPETSTFITSVVVDEVVPSVEVTETDRSKSASEFSAGVTVRPVRSDSDRVHVVTPSTTLEVPALRVAPSGTPVMVIPEMLSEASVTSAVIFRAMALSSRPETSATFSVGASASGSTETAMVPTVEAVSPPSASVEVAVTVRSKSASESLAGVTCKAVRSQPDMSALALPSPVKVLVPSVSTAPSGTPLMLMDRLSDPSVSVRPDAMSGRSMAVSSVPETDVADRSSIGVSASAATDT